MVRFGIVVLLWVLLPILVKRQFLCHFHQIDQLFLTYRGVAASCRGKPGNPIAYLRIVAHTGLAGGERQNAVVRIRGKTGIVRHLVTVKLRSFVFHKA